MVVHIRHNTPDVATLEELFLLGHYEMPPPVADALGRADARLTFVDLGANIGLFGAFVRGRFDGARVIGFEPDEDNAAVHELTIRANRADGRWQLVPACAATADGTVHFSGDGFTTARIEDGGKRVVPAVDVFPYLEAADVVKIDIEGAEWHLLHDVRFRTLPCRVVALEYHPYRCPAADPREHARGLLSGAGYETADHDLAATGAQGMLWAWRKI